MARQLGAVRYIGRLANTVGYKARDGKGDAFDAVRNHTVEVANPQTLAQMSQRMKLAPVQNFYRGLAGLLDHSWQGVKYGNPSRLHFYSLALLAFSTAGCPYVLKGDRKFVPWAFPISSGSIPVSITPEVMDSNDGNFLISLSAGSAPTTVGELSEALISNFLGLTNGQQITFIWVYNNEGVYIPSYKRFILNTSSDAGFEEIGMAISYISGEQKLNVTALNGNGEAIETQIVAAGVIVSALVNETWQRNNAQMVVVSSLRSQYNSQAAFNAMLESYRTSKNTNSDWYLNEGEDEGGSSTVATVREVTLTTSTGDKTLAYYKVGATKYAPYYETVLQEQPMICGYRKGGDMAFTKSQSMVLSGAPISEDLLTEYHALGYTLCTRTELLAIAPGLTIPE